MLGRECPIVHRGTVAAVCATVLALVPGRAAAGSTAPQDPPPATGAETPVASPTATPVNEPNLSPGWALGTSLLVTFGGAALGGGVMALSFAMPDQRLVDRGDGTYKWEGGEAKYAMLGLGGAITTLALAFGPEVGCFATDHVGRAWVMWGIRMGAGLLGAGIGAGIEAAATDCYGSGCFEGLFGAIIGGVIVHVAALVYEFYDTYAVVDEDWEAYRSGGPPPAPTAMEPHVVLVPALLPDGDGGLAGGLVLSLSL